MRASLMDSILDALSSFLAYHALKFANIPYDKKHNFGHEKAESLMALFQCLLVIYSGVTIYREAYKMFLNPQPIEYTEVGVVVMIISCFAVYQLIYFQMYVVSKTGSLLVKGDFLHYVSDFLMDICIMISLLLSRYFVYIDVLCGVTIGSYVLYNAFLVIKSALVSLMDTALPTEIQEKIVKIIESTGKVKRIKTLRTRSAGIKKYVESRIIVDKEMSLTDADCLTQKIESEIAQIFGKSDITVKAEISG
jgi:ferrous-iron efflux pump FieF